MIDSKSFVLAGSTTSTLCHLLDHDASSSRCRGLSFSNERASNRSCKPFVRNTQSDAITGADPSSVYSIRLRLVLIIKARSATFASSLSSQYFSASPTLGSWLLQQLVNRISLQSISLNLTEASVRHTFSSSLRFSDKFFLRLAISARRMACSSAEMCFLV